MEQTTRRRALDAAVALLAQSGASGVTMEAVATNLGIKAPSLYKHFENRADLMAQTRRILEEDYLLRHQALRAQLDRLSRDLKALGLLSPERFDQEVLSFLEPALTSPSARAYRQLLLSDGSGAAAYLQKTLLEPSEALQRFFEDLSGFNIFRRGESRVVALELVSPLAHLTALADVQAMSGGDLADLWADIRRHLKQFHRVYAVREKPAEKPVEKPAFPGLTTGGKRLFRGGR